MSNYYSLFLLSSCLLLFSSSQAKATLEWHRLNNREAVCNDYSRAGYFIEKKDPTKWLIFLESGGLCYSPNTCNNRFIHPTVRKDMNNSPTRNNNINLNQAWTSTSSSTLSKRINPFMTSMETTINDTGQFRVITGQDILDSNSFNNPVFYNYTRILIPYCSSDAWLGNDTRSNIVNNLNSNMNPQLNFINNIYDPDSSDLQFIFRGLVIFRSVIAELIDDENLLEADQLFLAGSSAGGLGVINHAQWVREQLTNGTNISILTDSAWFINFQRTIYNRFISMESSTNSLLSIIQSVPQCSNRDVTSPCCLRLQCMLSNPQYFPVGKIPVLAFFSLFDLYILTDTLAMNSVPGSGANRNRLGVELLTTITEYGGAMNTSITNSLNIPGLSFIVTQCFQHIYFATSNLWASNGVYRESAVEEISQELGQVSTSYKHTIESGVWTSYYFSGNSSQSRNASLAMHSCDSSDAATIQDAITMWVHCRYSMTFEFRDHCKSVYCNSLCPDEFVFSITEDNYQSWLIIAVNVTVVSITVFSILAMVVFYMWEVLLAIHEKLYLEHTSKEDKEKCLPKDTPDFPMCSLEEAVSVACIDLQYSVDFQPRKGKDEKQDKTTVSLVIDDIHQEDVHEKKTEATPPVRQPKRSASDWTAQFLLNRTHSTASFPRKSVIEEEEEENEDAFDYKQGRYTQTNLTNDTSTENHHTLQTGHKSSSSPDPTQPINTHQINTQPTQPNSTSSSTTTTNSNGSPYNRVVRSIDSNRSYGSQDSSSHPLMSYNKQHTDFLPSQPPPPAIDEIDGESVRLSSAQNSNSKLNQAQSQASGVFKCGKVRKEILRGISLYFNPGELVGIMGPSGCGKTTFLDLLTGRRNIGNISGHIYINGYPIDTVRKKYIMNTGYVLQLATPYYEELTVRENLTLSAHMKLPSSMSWKRKFERVEQVMNVTGLTSFQYTKVGGLSGPGLSGGQKKRLVIALQLLTMPSVIFLDEPTSGLDATSSIELLSHLNNLADSNRTVVLTIHQPRFEIFYMFHKLILLSDGKVAYHGVPQKAYGFFVEALMNKFLNRGLLMPQLEEHNPADVIMDMLGKPWMREVILDHFQNSFEPEMIKWAIKRARVLDFECSSIATLEREGKTSDTPYIRHSSNPAHINPKKSKTPSQANWFVRQAVLEVRAGKRTNFIWKVYLPIMFFLYGFVLGTTYLQQDTSLFILSGYCVYSVASALFMFPVLQNYYIKALEVYKYEKADGAGRAQDIVLQGFTRYAAMAIVPVVFSAGVLYLLLVDMRFWNGLVYLQLAVVNMALNQAWIALLTLVICASPSYCARISPMLSSITGFASGFFVPRDETQWYYRWIFYVNPNYYGFSATAKLLLSGFNNDCSDLDLECYINSGDYILYRYGFTDVNPFINIAVLLLMTTIFMMLAIFSNWLRHTTIKDKLKVLFKRSEDMFSDDDSETDVILYHEEEEEQEEEEEEEKRGDLKEAQQDKESLEDTVSEDEVFERSHSPTTEEPTPTPTVDSPHRVKWFKAFSQVTNKKESDGIEMKSISSTSKLQRQSTRTLNPSDSSSKSSKNRPNNLNLAERRRRLREPSCLLMEDQSHLVYQPGMKPPPTPSYQFANLVTTVINKKKETSSSGQPPRSSLKERQQDFDWHVKTTQEVVKERTEQIINDESEEATPTSKNGPGTRDLTKLLTQRIAERQPKMATVVFDAMVKHKSRGAEEIQSNPAIMNYSPATIANAWRSRARAKKQTSVYEPRGNMVFVPVDRLKELKRRVSQNSFRPEASPTVRFAQEETNKSPRQPPPSILKKSTSEKASTPITIFPEITEECDDVSSQGSFPHLIGTPVMPEHFFAGTEDREEEEEREEEEREEERKKKITGRLPVFDSISEQDEYSQ